VAFHAHPRKRCDRDASLLHEHCLVLLTTPSRSKPGRLETSFCGKAMLGRLFHLLVWTVAIVVLASMIVMLAILGGIRI
jgi:hypothetical protein